MPSWTNSATEPVLELLASTDLALPPAVITKNLERKMQRPPSKPTVERAIRELRERDLVRKIPDTRGYYVITEDGEQYLTRS